MPNDDKVQIRPKFVYVLEERIQDAGGKKMAIIVMIYGNSGSGKTTSLRNFQAGEISVFNISKKPFPFKCNFGHLETDDYKTIKEMLSKAHSPSIAIDDATYLIVNEFMRTAKVSSFQKFTDMALNFWELIRFCNEKLPPDKIVYFLGHSEQSETGSEKFKTVGRLLDEKVCLEGLFTIVLKTVVQDGKYYFATQTNGLDTVKSPMGMFQNKYIPNDLKAVDETIRSFYGIEKA